MMGGKDSSDEEQNVDDYYESEYLNLQNNFT